MIKSELRRRYFAAQKTLSPAEQSEKSRRVAENLFRSFSLRAVKFLHCFLPIARTGEINTLPIIQKIQREFPLIEIVVPRVNFETNEIESLKYTPETELRENRWRIKEPLHGEIIAAEKNDVVLIPLLCFDARGFRVGYGKGFYDRFLKTCRPDCLKIGLSYFEPVPEISDAQPFDVRLNFGITPERIVGCQS